jgi:hypothetical protein
LLKQKCSNQRKARKISTINSRLKTTPNSSIINNHNKEVATEAVAVEAAEATVVDLSVNLRVMSILSSRRVLRTILIFLLII